MWANWMGFVSHKWWTKRIINPMLIMHAGFSMWFKSTKNREMKIYEQRDILRVWQRHK